jgi:hypothetical protein
LLGLEQLRPGQIYKRGSTVTTSRRASQGVVAISLGRGIDAWRSLGPTRLGLLPAVQLPVVSEEEKSFKNRAFSPAASSRRAFASNLVPASSVFFDYATRRELLDGGEACGGLGGEGGPGENSRHCVGGGLATGVMEEIGAAPR